MIQELRRLRPFQQAHSRIQDRFHIRTRKYQEVRNMHPEVQYEIFRSRQDRLEKAAQPQKSLKLENRDKKVYSNNGDEYVDNSRRI